MCRSDELKSEELYRNYIEEDNKFKMEIFVEKKLFDRPFSSP